MAMQADFLARNERGLCKLSPVACGMSSLHEASEKLLVDGCGRVFVAAVVAGTSQIEFDWCSAR